MIRDRYINTLCIQGRIEGAVKFGTAWAIPIDAEKTKDERVNLRNILRVKDSAKHVWNCG